MRDATETLEAALAAEDARACRDLLLEMPEADRRQLAPTAWARHKELRGAQLHSHPALVLALAATATGEELRKKRWPLWPRTDHLFELLRTQRPTWLPEWADANLAKQPWTFDFFLGLHRAGVLPRPESEGWIQGLIRQGVHHGNEGAFGFLRAHPELAEDVWRLFEVEGDGECSLAAVDKYTAEDRGWSAGLRDHCAAGELDRDRLLTASLEALDRGFQAFRAGWFSRFHEAMRPDLEERAARQGLYVALLPSPVGATVSFALKALGVLRKAGRLEKASLLEGIDPALSAKAKGTAKKAFKLLLQSCKGDPELERAAARKAAAALGHEAREVQEAALDLVDRFGSREDDELLARLGEAEVVPSLRERLAEWVGAREETAAPESAPAELDEAGFPVTAVIPELGSLEELEALVGEICGGADLPVPVERSLAAVSRLGSGAAPALEQLTRELTGAWSLTRTEPLPVPTSEDFFLARLEEIRDRVQAGDALPLLSAPTHRPAWVAPRALADRLRVWEDAGREPGELDMVLALLRLAPGGRMGVRGESARLRGEAGAAFRFALGENVEIGPTASLWIAAAQARSPGQPRPELAARHPDLGPGAGEPPRRAVRVETWESYGYTHRTLIVDRAPPAPATVPTGHLPVILNTSGGGDRSWRMRRVAGTTIGQIRWAATLSPNDQQWFFAEAAEQIDLNWDEAQWEVAGFLELLGDPDTELGDMGTLLLALGLGAKEKGQRTLAVEALTLRAVAGTVDAAALGAWTARLLGDGYLLPARLGKTLGAAGASGKAEAKAVRDLLRAALRGDPGTPPRGLNAMLEVLREQLVDSGESLGDAEARDYLEGLKKTGKTGKLAKAILALG